MSVQFQYGDLLTINNVDVICHQVNCLTTKPHGLSKLIADRLPWADIYATRRRVKNRNLAVNADRGIPGTIRIFSRNDRSVVCLQAQWDFGGPGCKRSIPPYDDIRVKREEWYKNCLDELDQLAIKRIAMPFKIGCGMAKGYWPNYLTMIKEFAQHYKKDVVIVVHH